MLDMVSDHRMSTINDKGGETICTTTNYTDYTFKFNDYVLKRARVKGFMTSENIAKACAGLHERDDDEGKEDEGVNHYYPVCDIGTVADGICRIVGGDDWHFSHPGEVKQKLPLDGPRMKGAYFYNGESNGGLSVLHTGKTHQWAKSEVDKDGDTYCAKRAKSFKHSFKWKGYTIVRTPVAKDKAMTSKNILAACKAKDMVPVCNHAKFMDGQCVIVGGFYHISKKESAGLAAARRLLGAGFPTPPPTPARRTEAEEDSLPTDRIRGTYTYCGDADGPKGCSGWSYLDTGTQHRLARHTDRGGDTLCTTPNRQKSIFVIGDHQFVRVKVHGFMTGSNALAECQKISMLPVCEAAKYKDITCIPIGSFHLATPVDKDDPSEKAHEIPPEKLKGAYFYVGEERDGGRMLLNNGKEHVWSTQKVDRDGDTFCVQSTVMKGHGECNCPSVNQLMINVDKASQACDVKKGKNATSVTSMELGEDDKAMTPEERKWARMTQIMRDALPPIPPKSNLVDPESFAELMDVKPKSAVVLLQAEERAEVKSVCSGKCGDVRGFVKEIYAIETGCGMDTNLDMSKLEKVPAAAAEPEGPAEKPTIVSPGGPAANVIDAKRPEEPAEEDSEEVQPQQPVEP